MLAEIRRYVAAARKWGWLAALSMVMAVGLTIGHAAMVEPVYTATTSIRVSTQNPLNADYINLLGAEEVITTYKPLMTSTSVLSPVTQRYPQISQSRLASAISLAVVTDKTGKVDNPILYLTVSLNNAQMAADLANAVMSSFISYENALNSVYAPQRLQALNTDLSQLQSQANVLTDQITRDEALGLGQNEIQTLQSALDDVNAELTTLQSVRDGVQTRIDQVSKNFTVIAPATPSTKPVDQQVLQHTLLSLLVGLLAAAGLAVIFEALADKARTVTLVERWLKPVLGIIPQESFTSLVTPEIASPAIQAYAGLRARLGAAIGSSPSQVLLVVSAAPDQDTAAWVASNLALLQASSGREVLLVDGMMDRPVLDRIFGLSNEQGLSNILTEMRRGRSEYAPLHAASVVPGVALITAGPPPINTSDLLDSIALQRFITEACDSQVDQVIIVGPPVLAGVDATLLGMLADGILVTVDATKTTVSQVERAAALLQRAKLSVLGVVLCKSDASLAVMPKSSDDLVAATTMPDPGKSDRLTSPGIDSKA